MEVATDEVNTPIKQDMKKGKLRFYHYDSLVNYGCIPQTWEDPAHIDTHTSYGGSWVYRYIQIIRNEILMFLHIRRW